MSDLHTFRRESNFSLIPKEFAKTTYFNAGGCLHFFQASACGGTCPGTAEIDKSAGNSASKTPRRPPGCLHFTGQTAMQFRRPIACVRLRFLSHVLDRSKFFFNFRRIGPRPTNYLWENTFWWAGARRPAAQVPRIWSHPTVLTVTLFLKRTTSLPLMPTLPSGPAGAFALNRRSSPVYSPANSRIGPASWPA